MTPLPILFCSTREVEKKNVQATMNIKLAYLYIQHVESDKGNGDRAEERKIILRKSFCILISIKIFLSHFYTFMVFI